MVFRETQGRGRIATRRRQMDCMQAAVRIHAIEAAGRCDPQASALVFHDRADVVAAQAIADGEIAEQRLPQAEQAAVGADPDAALGVLEKLGDAAARQIEIVGHAFHAIAPGDAEQAEVFRAEPELSVAILEHRRQATLVRHPVLEHRSAILHEVKAVLGGNPESPVAGQVRPGEAAGRQSEIRCNASRHAVAIDVPVEQAAEAADPQTILLVERHACIGLAQR